VRLSPRGPSRLCALDASTFRKNRRRRFAESGVLERLFDETVKRALAERLVSRRVSADGTLVRADASYRSFLPIAVALDPEEYKRRRRAMIGAIRTGWPIPAIGLSTSAAKSGATLRSLTDPDCRFVSKARRALTPARAAHRAAHRGGRREPTPSAYARAHACAERRVPIGTGPALAGGSDETRASLCPGFTLSTACS
jgi:hypothetical protein